MKILIALAFIGLTLAGCGSSADNSGPTLVGTWISMGPQSAARQKFEFKADGSFSRESAEGGPAKSVTVNGSWSAIAWNEPSYWQRVWQEPDQVDVLGAGVTGKPAKRYFNSNAEVTLRYWVLSGSAVPVGGKIVEKRTDRGTEAWMIEERGEITRRTEAATGYPNRIVEIILVALAELNTDRDRPSTLRLSIGGARFARQTPGGNGP